MHEMVFKYYALHDESSTRIHYLPYSKHKVKLTITIPYVTNITFMPGLFIWD